jgi:hypothetical protein
VKELLMCVLIKVKKGEEVDAIPFHCVARDSKEAFEKATRYCEEKKFEERGIQVIEINLTDILHQVDGYEISLTKQ